MFRYNSDSSPFHKSFCTNLYPSMFRYNYAQLLNSHQLFSIYIPLCSDITRHHEVSRCFRRYLYPSMFRYNEEISSNTSPRIRIYIPLCSDITQYGESGRDGKPKFISLYVQI